MYRLRCRTRHFYVLWAGHRNIFRLRRAEVSGFLSGSGESDIGGKSFQNNVGRRPDRNPVRYSGQKKLSGTMMCSREASFIIACEGREVSLMKLGIFA